ncbi:MAG TPA: tetratricopeptide repeat protein, partial [Candidatus Izemoplasmatales bacterium]|nr:tetratricopeptide repeat protein [Candidatus Izemoplasmatales bacterium]
SENNDENPIQLINPKGVDVIKRNGYFPPMGDIQYVEGMNNYVIDGPSQMVDIAYTDDGIYTVLDQKRSRLFTYDSEGNLLYIDGDEGRQTDKFSEGVAIDYFGDNLLVLDRKTKSITVYGLTEFGAYVNLAIHYHKAGKFEEAALVWEKVVQINSNYEIAYNGIGKLMLRQERYDEAMEYFKLGHDQYYYSKAYKEYRNNIIKSNFGYIMGGIVLVVGSLIGLRIRRIYKKGGTILYED